MLWFYLILAGLSDLTLCTVLKINGGFNNFTSIVFFVAYGPIVFYLLSLVMKNIPLATAYLVWNGVGALGVIIVGILFFRDPINIWAFLSIALIVIGIMGLRVMDCPIKKEEENK